MNLAIDDLIKNATENIHQEPSPDLRQRIEKEMKTVYRWVKLNSKPTAPKSWDYHLVAGQPLVWIFSGCYWFDNAGGCGPCDGYGKKEGIGLDKAIEDALAFHEQDAQKRLAEDTNHYTINIGGATTFHDAYFPQQSRRRLFEGVNRIAQPFLTKGKKVMYVFETRMRDIHERDLEEVRKYVDARIPIEIGVGVESSIDWIREHLVNKGYGDNALTHFADLINQSQPYGVSYEGHALLGIPGLNELEAIANAVITTRDLLDIGVQRVVLMTSNIKEGSSLGTSLYKHGLFKPVSLHATVATIRTLHDQGYSNFLPFGFAASDPTMAYAEGCDNCTPKIKEALDQYGRTALYAPTQAAVDFSMRDTNCDYCKEAWQEERRQESDQSLLKRIPKTIETWKQALLR